MNHYRYDLSTKAGCSIKEFVIKETNGNDEENAALASKAKGGAATVFEELVRLSITHVDGQAVQPPLLEYDGWNSRTRAFVLNAFKQINGIENEEVQSFLKAGVPFQP